MSDHFASLIRTWVPIGVGAALTWLAATLGIGLDPDSSAQLTVAVTALVVAVYYGLVRALESRWPWLGVLLGKREQPVYGQPPAETHSETELDPEGNIRVIRSVTTWPEVPTR